jgi:hypothetical protein
MAKAALNMLTHTAAELWQKTEFYECSRYGLGNRRRSCKCKRKQEEQDFQPPLDIVDGAAQ